MKAFGTMFAGGLVSLILMKVFASILGPLTGVLFGFFALAFKIGLFLGVGFFLYRVFKARRDKAMA